MGVTQFPMNHGNDYCFHSFIASTAVGYKCPMQLDCIANEVSVMGSDSGQLDHLKMREG